MGRPGAGLAAGGPAECLGAGSHPAPALLPALATAVSPSVPSVIPPPEAQGPVPPPTLVRKARRVQRTDGPLQPGPVSREQLTLWVGQERRSAHWTRSPLLPRVLFGGSLAPPRGAGTLSPPGLGVCRSQSASDGRPARLTLPSQAFLRVKPELSVCLDVSGRSCRGPRAVSGQ